MELKVTSSSITEPVTKAELKAFMGYPSTDTSQDDIMDIIITAAREWFEQRTGLSVVSKYYSAYFEEDDRSDGWFELPVNPVTGTPVVTVCGVVTSYQQKGSKVIKISPDNVYGTIPVGGLSYTYYVEVTFTAGAKNEIANVCIMGIASSIFNYREGGLNVNVARIPFDTLTLIDSLSNNV